MSLAEKRARILELQRELAALRSEVGVREADPHEAMLRFATERAGQLGTWSWNLITREIAWSEELYRIFGLDPKLVTPSAETFERAVHPHDRQRVKQASRRSLATGVAEAVEFRVVRPNGELREVRMEATFLPAPDGTRGSVVGTLIDNTDKHKAAALMAKTLAELREAQQLACIGSWQWNLAEGRVEWSEGMYRLLHLDFSEPASETLFFKHVHPDDVAYVRAASDEAVQTGIPQQLELRMVRTDGAVRDVIMRSRAHFDERHRLSGFQGVLQDVTERKALEDAARHAQKMEAIGTLAGGVAHDFNNYLMVIGGNLDLLAMRYPKEHEARRYLDAIQFAYERCASLTEQLLTLSRKRPPQPRRFDMVERVEALAPVLRSVLGPKSELRLELSRSTPPAFADPGQVEHALMNLVLNARDAMGDEGGTVCVSVEGLCVEPRAKGSFDEGFYVRLSVSDTGCGIASELHSRIFEPFFTTKSVGRGTGLGLAAVYGIVRDAGGGIELDSRPGEGATFHLYFCPAPAEAARSAHERPHGAARGQGQCVLLVEDVKLVRELLCDQLVQGGYRVITAGDGEEALHRLRSQALDILVSDVVMPKLGGLELVRAARELWPKLPCLLMSGYSTASFGAPGDSLHVPVLRKPFSAQQLRNAISELLAGERS